MKTFPFEASPRELKANLDAYVDAVFGCLESEFMSLPKGKGFIEYHQFEAGYETLKLATSNFRNVNPSTVGRAVDMAPIALVVLRCMLGFTPVEWAHQSALHSGITISPNLARSIDRNIRLRPGKPLSRDGTATSRVVQALIASACHLLRTGTPKELPGNIHRLDKVDTKKGLQSLRLVAKRGLPYPILLYERHIGRPFAGHRDSVSELIGNTIENAIEDTLSMAGVSYRKTTRSASLKGFDQAPDFVIPDESNPQVVIEAKLANDDGSARDKITRIQHLSDLRIPVTADRRRQFQLVACIAGRGFGVRREDMKKLLLATKGKVFTLQQVHLMAQNTRVTEFRDR